MMRSPIYRLIQVITLMIAAVFAVSGFFGLRELAWRHDAAVNTQLLSGLVLSALAVGVPGVLYIIFGSPVLRALRIDWMSLQFGALVGMILYGGYNVITPLTVESAHFDPGRRLLTGAVDGLLIGLVIGGVVTFVSGRPLAFTRADLLRYFTLYAVVIGVAWFVVVFSTTTKMADVLALAVTALIVGLIKVIVLQVDRRKTHDEA